jgi:two-component system, OmpR family, sensor histidine kinase KdpD
VTEKRTDEVEPSGAGEAFEQVRAMPGVRASGPGANGPAAGEAQLAGAHLVPAAVVPTGLGQAGQPPTGQPPTDGVPTGSTQNDLTRAGQPAADLALSDLAPRNPRPGDLTVPIVTLADAPTGAPQTQWPETRLPDAGLPGTHLPESQLPEVEQLGQPGTETEPADAGLDEVEFPEPELVNGDGGSETGAAAAARRAPAVLVEGDDTASVVEAAGHFRIYLGAVAGVGKTYDMLNEGKRRLERGTDVVVGFVEAHKRPLTEALLVGFEIVPRKKVEYRGAWFEEMDLDAVKARHPKVALVDELAHTNVPGSGRHAKRWEDVLELLDAGIDVITTLNIQHVESLADAVEQMTGAHVRERVPDWVVRKANQIELVDSSPEQLRRRMLHGNIYPAEKIPYALTHFFQTDNLIALRELALRYLADETEEELLEHLRRHSQKRLWETRERILVAVTGAPGTDVLLRRAARMASRAKGELNVVHIISSDAKPEKDKAGFESLRKLVSDLGAHWYEVAHSDPAQAITDFAQEHQITQIVLGSSQRSRWQELTGGGPIVRKVIRRAGDLGIDVHVIARRQLPAGFDHSTELPEES